MLAISHYQSVGLASGGTPSVSIPSADTLPNMGPGGTPLGSLGAPLSMHPSCVHIGLTQSEVLTLNALALIKAKSKLGCLTKAHVQYSNGGFLGRIYAFASIM